jgi:hypothetical protein
VKLIFLILAGGDALLITVAAVVGLLVEGERFYFQHFLLGLMAALYNCLFHVIVFTAFVVCGRIVREAVDRGATDAETVAAVLAGKSRVLRYAMLGIIWTLATAALGAIVTEPGAAAAWGVSTRWHLVAGLGMLPVNLIAMTGEFVEVDRNGRLFERAFGDSRV